MDEEPSQGNLTSLTNVINGLNDFLADNSQAGIWDQIFSVL